MPMLDALLISTFLAMPMEPAPHAATAHVMASQAEPPTADPHGDEPIDDPTERELQLEEELAEARARAADLEKMIDDLRRQVAQLQAELAARPIAPAPPPAAPRASTPPRSDSSAPAPRAPAQTAPDPTNKRSWDEDPEDSRAMWPAPRPSEPMQPAPPTDAMASAESFLASIREVYSSRFPSAPSPSQGAAFDAFSGDVVKWSAAQQRSMRAPITWRVNFVRVEKGSSRDRMVRVIARSAGPGAARGGSGGTFVVRMPRAEADELLQGDYRSTVYEVTGTLAPIVRFAPERPFDGVSSNHSAFVGPYCETAIVVDSTDVRPGT